MEVGSNVMKKILPLLFILLTGCIFMQSEPQQDYKHPVETFEYSERCPNICWLGIQPNITTKDEVRAILKASDLIERKSIEWSDNEVTALWSVKYIGPVNAHIDVGIEDDMVSYIAITQPHPLTTADLIELLGSPEEISIFVDHSTSFTWYYLYYFSLRVIIEAWNNRGEVAGPQPNDDIMFFMVDITDNDLLGKHQRIYEEAQPWLGYGCLEEYLPGEEIP